jgi:hypothetical protein
LNKKRKELHLLPSATYYGIGQILYLPHTEKKDSEKGQGNDRCGLEPLPTTGKSVTGIFFTTQYNGMITGQG